MSAPVFTWPVVSLSGGPYRPTPQVVAVFFEQSDAADFVLHSDETLHIWEPRYDRRKSGYRPAPQRNWRAEFLAWCEEADNRLTECRGDPMLSKNRRAA